MNEIVATYSIVACDLDAEQWGVSVQSKFLSVGSVVPWAEPHVGAIATQAYANPRYGPNGLQLLREGLTADEVDDEKLRRAHDEGTPVVVRADSKETLLAALARPEVACVIVPPEKRDLLDLDLIEGMYGRRD